MRVPARWSVLDGSEDGPLWIAYHGRAGMAPSHAKRMEPRYGRGATALMDELADRIESHIVGRAGGRVRDLRVVCADNTVILQGRTRTYHDKQLVQEAVLDVADECMILANQIIVS